MYIFSVLYFYSLNNEISDESYNSLMQIRVNLILNFKSLYALQALWTVLSSNISTRPEDGPSEWVETCSLYVTTIKL